MTEINPNTSVLTRIMTGSTSYPEAENSNLGSIKGKRNGSSNMREDKAKLPLFAYADYL